MPTPQTSISIDKDTKDRATRRAKKDNMPLAVVVRILLVDYANGNISVGARTGIGVLAEEIPVDKETQKKMDEVVKKWRGKV
ncbi:hypothetical protein KJ652_06590 [Patescibacteria group bacterium]|nr:hypothetical protein [Patescibacteria group bacterium]MBU1124219.1 hypothetical protein [Patescibacteria group bacterium]MBU1911212.1 hypothetical protein [Patescibacteria group bacterium]